MTTGKTLKSSNTITTITNSTSELKWLADLNELLKESKSRFADVIWSTTEGELIYGNKCIIYARAAGSFQLKYLNNSNQQQQQQQNQHNNNLQQDPRRNSSSRSLPFQPYNPSTRSLASSHDFHENALFLRTPSPSTSINSTTSTIYGGPMNLIPIPLEGTDPATFAGCLEFLYTGAKAAEVFAVLFDGFEEGLRDENDNEISSIVRLRQDLLYAWRSKLFADVSLALDDGSRTVFASHRAILASRSPYFQSLLLGNYGDSNRTEFILPSPPFTPASTVFCLGYIYSGTLDFGDRSFDLNTAFDIWRCGTYLSMEELQLQTEDKIIEMLNLKRSARIFQFSMSPDVNSIKLINFTEPYLINHFSEIWSCSQIGNLDFLTQKNLVIKVCKTIIPSTVTSIGKSTFSLRKKLELERSPWAGHILSMVEAIEDKLRDVMSKNLNEIVVSTGFVDLIDGVGFSTDVLEWLLELAVGGLTEAKAPEAYQALVGSVLLREEGITMDAKVLVEDAKNGILKYIKRKCVGIKSARGFENLEPWCLKEISDEIEVSLEDLQAISNRPPVSTSRTGLRITPKRSNTTLTTENNTTTPSTLRSPIILSTARTPSTVTPRTNAVRPVNRPAATAIASTSTSTATTTTTTSSAMSPPTSTTRAPRTATTSTTSRQSATPAASVNRSRSNGRTSTTMSRNPSNATTSSSTGESTTSNNTPIRSPRPLPPALPISNISTPPVASTSRSTGSRTPTSSITRRPTSLAPSTTILKSIPSVARPPNPPFNTSNRVNVPVPTSNRIVPKARTPPTPSVPFPSTRTNTGSNAATSSPAVTTTTASVKGKERAKSSSISSTTSTTPAVTSGRTNSITSTRTINGTRLKSNEMSVRPPPSTTTTTTTNTSSSLTITAAKVGRSNSITSTKSTRSTSTLGGRIAPRPNPIVKTPPLPSTSTSKSTIPPAVKTNLKVPATQLSPKSYITPPQEEVAISIPPVSLPQVVPTLSPTSIPAPVPSAPLAISTTLTNRDMNLMPPKEPNSELRRTFSTKTLPPPSPTRISPARPAPLTSIPPSFSSRHSQPLASPPLVPFSTLPALKAAAVASVPNKVLPGTTLLSGIPCIVTVDVDKHTARFRAAVRYLGGVLWKGGESGQWVGVEVVESSIPDECLGLDWNDGEVEGVVYFKVTPESNRSKNVSRATSAAGNYSEVPSPSLEGSTSSLRPPSRRPRRSSSTDGGSIGYNHQDGPRRGLFVRPNQIVYVL